MSLEIRKHKLIEYIINLDDEALISKLEQLLYSKEEGGSVLFSLMKPMREKLDIEALMKEQNYKHPSKELLDQIIEEADIEESIEELLEMI